MKFAKIDKKTIAYATCLAAILCIAFGLMTAQTAAWLTEEEEAYQSVAVSDFQVEGHAFFTQLSNPTEAQLLQEMKTAPPADLKDINLVNAGAPNHLSRLCFGITYKGISPAFVRVRILEQWIDNKEEEVVATAFTGYRVREYDASAPDRPGWIDWTREDYCFYYSHALPVKNAVTGSGIGLDGTLTEDAVEEYSLMLFQGVDTDQGGIDSVSELILMFEVDAVQPNRYRELWFHNQELMPPGGGRLVY